MSEFVFSFVRVPWHPHIMRAWEWQKLQEQQEKSSLVWHLFVTKKNQTIDEHIYFQDKYNENTVFIIPHKTLFFIQLQVSLASWVVQNSKFTLPNNYIMLNHISDLEGLILAGIRTQGKKKKTIHLTLRQMCR